MSGALQEVLWKIPNLHDLGSGFFFKEMSEAS
jgi:hypothetical protein